MAVNFRHGKNGQCKVGTTALKITGWTVDDQSELADSSNTLGGGYKEQTPGLQSADITIDAQWRADQSPWDTTPSISLVTGGQLANVTLHTGTPGTGVPFWSFPLMDVEKASVKSVVNGVITYAISGKSSGSYSPPLSV